MWCGKESSAPFIAGTINPCIYNTLISITLLLWGAFATHHQHRKWKAILAVRSSRVELFWSSPYAGPLHILQTAIASVLTLFHALAFLYFLDQVIKTPYLLLSELLLSITWALVLTLLVWVSRKHVSVKLTSLAGAAAMAYLFGLYSEVQFYVHGMGITPFERKFRLAASVVASLLVLGFAAAERSKYVLLIGFFLLRRSTKNKSFLNFSYQSSAILIFLYRNVFITSHSRRTMSISKEP